MSRVPHLIVVLLSIILLLSGCSKSDDTKFVLAKDGEAFDVSLVPLSFSEGTAPSVACVAFGNKVYYLVNFQWPMATGAKRVELYQHDMDTGTSNLLHTWEGSELYWMNELRTDGNMVYWARLTTDERCILEGFDLSKQEIHQLYCSTVPLIFGGNKDRIAWYDMGVADCVDIKFLDTQSQQITTISHESLALQNWARPSLYRNKLLTLLADDDDTYTFSLLDTETSEVQSLFDWPLENGYVTPQLNEKYIVWRDDFGGTLIYVYDMEKGQQFAIDTKEWEVKNISSIRLVDNFIYINTGSGILYLNLKVKIYGTIAQSVLSELGSDKYIAHQFALADQQTFLLENLGAGSDYYALVVRPK